MTTYPQRSYVLNPDGTLTYPFQDWFAQADKFFGNIQSIFPRAAAAPTTGAHQVGEIVFKLAPTAGDWIGWVCVTAGTPGAWKQFGAIEP